MCQSKEQGGRRCAGGNPFASNYPSYLSVDTKNQIIVMNADSFAERPGMALHAAVLAARTGYRLSNETVVAAESVSKRFSEVSLEEVWEHWNDILLARKPSAGLEAIHEMGWEGNFPELAAIRGVPQSPIWHPEGDVEIHTQQAADVAAERALAEGLDTSETRVAVMGAICHDFGKSVSTKIDEQGNITSAGHDEEGQPIAQAFLERIGATEDVMTQVPVLVREHMCHTNTPTYKNVRKMVARLEEAGTTFEAWTRVAEADRGGRGSASKLGSTQQWVDVKANVDKYKVQQFSNLVSGAMLRELQYENTNEYRGMINASRKAQYAGIINTPEEALAWLSAEYPNAK